MTQRLSVPHTSEELTAEQLRQFTVGQLCEYLPLGLHGYRYTDADIFNVVVAAAAQGRSIASACAQLRDAPSATRVRDTLAERVFARQDLDALEARLNALLVAQVPVDILAQPQRVAIDLTLLPYYGTAGLEADQLRRGEAKAGTTRFHCYATASVLRAGRRVTLALTFVHAEEALADVLEDLLGRIARLGVAILRLFLDREFASVAILTLLARQSFPAIVALPKRGDRLKALLCGRTSYQTSYTMRSADDGEITFPLYVACRYTAGRRGRHGIDYLPFAVVGQGNAALRVRQVAREYRWRFGIESGYRQMHAVRAPTTSRDPALRLLLVAVAVLLTNLWVWLKLRLLAATPPRHRPHARAWLDAALRLASLCDLLLEAIKACYHIRAALRFPFPLRAPLNV
jgi:putative transposase